MREAERMAESAEKTNVELLNNAIQQSMLSSTRLTPVQKLKPSEGQQQRRQTQDMMKRAARRRVIVEDSDDDFGDAVALSSPPKMRARKSAPAFPPPRLGVQHCRRGRSSPPTSRVVSYSKPEKKRDGSEKSSPPKVPASRPKQLAAPVAQMLISPLSRRISSGNHNPKHRKLTFFSLLEQDRVAIYEHHLIVEGAGIELAVQAPFIREPALLAASREIRREALPIWYKENTFHSRFIYDIVAWLDRLDFARLSMLQWVNLDEPLPAGFVLPGLRKLNKRVKDGLKRNVAAVPVVVEKERESDFSVSHATIHDKDSCKREMVTMDEIGQYNDLDGMWETLQRQGVGKRILTNVTRKKRRSKGARDGSNEHVESDEDGGDGTSGDEEMGGM